MATNGKFIAYYRVSTKAQGNSGLGLEAQQQAVSFFLNGGDWTLVGEYQDVESGTRKGNNRPELAKAIAHAKREKATLIIAKLDRLARNVAFISRLMESGVDFVAADNPSANKLTIHILAAVAEAEADAISKRTKEALAAAKARGVQLGKPENASTKGQVRGAAATESKAFKEYAHLAPRILAMRAKGDSFGAIATKLNSEGELTREGRPFKAMTVKRISDRLQDPSATSTPARKKRRHPLMEPIPSEVLALIPEAEHDVNRLRSLASSPSLEAQVRTAAEVYLKRYEAIAADPDRWVPSYIEESIDQVVAMSRFDATSADELLDFASPVPVARQLRRQVYWAWMKNDARHLSASRCVYEPFMCDVGPRHVAQRSQYKLSSQDAAEFYSLAHFLPAYHRATGKTLSLIRKGFPEEQSGINEPDFIVRDQATGEEVGIEMTDAIAGKRAMRDRFFWELVADLEDRLPGFEGTVTIADRQYDEKSDIRWEEVARNYRDIFLNEIVMRVSGATRGKFRLSVAQDPGLRDILVSFQCRKGLPLFLLTDQYGWCGDKPERIARENLVQSLRNKAENPAPYCTNRTLLVVYPINHVPMMGYERVLEQARMEIEAVVAQKTRFQEVWLSKEAGLWPLHVADVPATSR